MLRSKISDIDKKLQQISQNTQRQGGNVSENAHISSLSPKSTSESLNSGLNGIGNLIDMYA